MPRKPQPSLLKLLSRHPVFVEYGLFRSDRPELRLFMHRPSGFALSSPFCMDKFLYIEDDLKQAFSTAYQELVERAREHWKVRRLVCLTTRATVTALLAAGVPPDDTLLRSLQPVEDHFTAHDRLLFRECKSKPGYTELMRELESAEHEPLSPWMKLLAVLVALAPAESLMRNRQQTPTFKIKKSSA